MWKRSKGRQIRPERLKPKRTTKQEMKINWTCEDSSFASEKDNRNPIAHCKSVWPRNQKKPFTVDCLRNLKPYRIALPTSSPIQLCVGESSPYRHECRWNTKDSILLDCQTILKRTSQTDRKPTGKKTGFFSLYIGAISGPFWSIDQAPQNRQFSTGQTDPKKRQKSGHIPKIEYGLFWGVKGVNHCSR